MGGTFPFFSRERNPFTKFTREFTKDKQQGEAKLKAMAAKPKEKSRTHPGPRHGPDPCGPSEVLIGKGSCCSFCGTALPVTLAQNTAHLHWGSFSCGSTFAQERHCKWPGGDCIWPLQNENLEKKALKYVTRAPSYHLFQTGAEMSI